MKNKNGFNAKSKFYLLIVICTMTIIGITTAAHADWNFGIGTGILFLNAEGDQGLHVNLINMPVTLDVDLDPDDFQDLMESAIGFGGYATDGTWMIKYSYGKLELGGDASRTISAINTTVSADIGFDITGAEATVGYAFYKSPELVVSVDGGARYIKHELDATIKATGAITGSRSRSIDESWTDVLIGASVAVPFSSKWIWNTSANAGLGGSDGTYHGSTGITWRFLEHWSTTLHAKYTAIDFENGSKGDSDWYLYDANEFGWGINVLYNW